MSVEQTVTKHAQALLESATILQQYAVRAVRWQPGGTDGAARIPRSVAVDLFGCFDGVAIDDCAMWWLIQWTSDTDGGGVAYRRRKIEERWLSKFESLRGDRGEADWLMLKMMLSGRVELAIWAWVKGKGFRVLRFDFLKWSWSWDRHLTPSPLLRGRGRRRSIPSPEGGARLGEERTRQRARGHQDVRDDAVREGAG